MARREATLRSRAAERRCCPAGVARALASERADFAGGGRGAGHRRQRADPGRAIGLRNTLLRVDRRGFFARAGKIADGGVWQCLAGGDRARCGRSAARCWNIWKATSPAAFIPTRRQRRRALCELAPRLRERVGRLLNDKMPTGVAVSPAMNHGGPYPATGHPGFTAVGIPASLRRFAMLQCYDNVRPARLPAALAGPNPNGKMWRLIDGQWTQGNV